MRIWNRRHILKQTCLSFSYEFLLLANYELPVVCSKSNVVFVLAVFCKKTGAAPWPLCGKTEEAVLILRLHEMHYYCGGSSSYIGEFAYDMQGF